MSNKQDIKGIHVACTLGAQDHAGLWDSIHVSNDLKDSLLCHALLNFTLRPKVSRTVIPLHGIILLVGKPGTGKTSLARGLASKTAGLLPAKKIAYLEVEPHSLTSAAMGKTQKAVTELFGQTIAEYAQAGPTFVLLDEVETLVNHGRTQRLREQIRDFLVIAQDTGMRPKEILRMRIEHIDWDNRRIWNPHGKTAKSRRFVPMSQRMKGVLEARCGKQKDGWVFPSDRSKTGHLNSIAVGFRALRERVGVSNKIVPYSARHTYGSFTMEATGNIFAVADSMGHVDVQSMKPYQHPRLEPLREVIDRRNEANGSRHVLRHVGKKQA